MQLDAHPPRISIHAPRTGSDTPNSCYSVRAFFISIHAPRTGSDGVVAILCGIGFLFQSTLPARGATFSQYLLHPSLKYFNPRSPHGERPSPRLATTTCPLFQSTLPARGATYRTGEFCASPSFQSTLPARGATGKHPVYYHQGKISIHAPRTGSDRRSARHRV